MRSGNTLERNASRALAHRQQRARTMARGGGASVLGRSRLLVVGWSALARAACGEGACLFVVWCGAWSVVAAGWRLAAARSAAAAQSVAGRVTCGGGRKLSERIAL
jgi:hypothetical protein